MTDTPRITLPPGYRIATCGKCGCDFTYEPIRLFGREVFPPQYCFECQKIIAVAMSNTIQATFEKQKQLNREAGWRQLCPPAYQATDPAMLPNRRLMDTVLQWQYNPRGLALHGPTGTGKSRCAYELLKREHYNGRKCHAISSCNVARYPVLLMEDASKARKWIDQCIQCQLLLMDDVFKVKLSERVEEALFCIIEERAAFQHPIIATMNDTSKTIAERVSPDRAEPMIRRLREFCEAIHCDMPKP